MSKYKRSGRPQSSRCKRTTRPCLEALESRLVLSTYRLADGAEPRSVRWRRERRRRGPVSQHPRAGRRPGRAGLLGRAAQGGREPPLRSPVSSSSHPSTRPMWSSPITRPISAATAIRRGSHPGWPSSRRAPSEETVAAAFLASPEYSAKHVADDDFVQSLYENILGRAGDPAGINSWTQPLEAGTSRGAVVASFISSPESSQISIDDDYNDFLARVGDTAGVDYWMAQIENGSKTMAEVAAQFAGSPEYATLASQEPAPATQLVVTTPPASVTANAPFGLTVAAENGSGIIDTTYTGPVTLVLSGGTSGAVLGGTLTGTAANGVAAFTGLTINTAGTGYTLTASSAHAP